MIVLAIVSMIISFGFTGVMIWLGERKEQRWFEFANDLINRRMAPSFYEFCKGKEMIMDAKGRNPKVAAQLQMDVIDQFIAERAEKEKEASRMPAFINQPKPEPPPIR